MKKDTNDTNNSNKNNKNSKRPIIYYYLVAFLIVIILNSTIVPLIVNRNTKEIPYSEFLTMLSDKEISEVDISYDKIVFTPKDKSDKLVYFTGRPYDENLINRLIDSEAKFTQIITPEPNPFLTFILSWIMPFVMFFLLWQLIGKVMGKKLGGNSMSFGKSKAKVYVAAQTGKTFKDVAGQDEAKEALTEIVDFLHDPAKYKEIGARLPNGALLVGPPGTGKTLLAQAVAGEASVPFFSISGSEFVEMFVGMGAARVRDLFKQAQEKAPCIVFIDEIDAIGKKRDNSGMGGNDEREQTLNQLLTEMDGFDGGKGVVILAATNRPETLDKALLRPGRFDRRIPAELPDLKGREDILRVHTKNVKASDDIDFNAIARATSGASGAELANIVNEAALSAVKDDRKFIIQKDLEESVETVIAGYQRKNAVISMKDKLTIAYHEIGHALVAAKQKNSAPVHKITIIPRTSGALGYTMQIDEGEKVLMSKEECLNKIVTFTGGRAAEELIFDSITSGASNDIEQATKIARAMITRFGMSDEFDMMALETVSNQYLGRDSALACSAETATKVDTEVLSVIKTAHATAKEILANNVDKLHELSKYLLEKETITGEEFMNILNSKILENEELISSIEES